jgi:peptidoglycan hydrolase-like protein with peptidoglycan-binding domain
VQRGVASEDVRALQEALSLNPDGIFGPTTERAVRDFQRERGLSADGIVGMRTWQALELICSDATSAGSAPTTPPPSGQAAPAQPAPTPPPATPTTRGTDVIVTIDTARRSGSTISVTGTATVPDGAFVAYELVPTRGGLSVKEGAARVQGERFSFDANVSGFPSGSVEVWVAFVTILGGPTYDATQPRAVLDLYGNMGEKITGPNVTPGLLRLVEAIRIVN